MAQRGIGSVDWLFGLHQSGHMTKRYLHGLLARLPDNCAIELYFHPAADLGARPPNTAAQREVELLTDPQLRGLLARYDMRLTTYRTFAESARAARGARLRA